MFLESFISGLLLGFVSSFHCLGMCGPLVLALPFNQLPSNRKIIGIIVYHLGRIFIYTLLGILFGYAGRKFFIAGYQQWFSIILGVMVLLGLVSYVLNKSYLKLKWVDFLTNKIQQFIVANIKRKNFTGIMLVGAANGLLPCGMVYFAIAGAMATGSVQNSSFFMLAFGLGTLPFMFLASHFGVFLKISVRNTIKKLVPFFIAVMGILLILRGLNLGIPYISPQFQNSSDSSIICH